MALAKRAVKNMLSLTRIAKLGPSRLAGRFKGLIKLVYRDVTAAIREITFDNLREAQSKCFVLDTETSLTYISNIRIQKMRRYEI